MVFVTERRPNEGSVLMRPSDRSSNEADRIATHNQLYHSFPSLGELRLKRAF